MKRIITHTKPDGDAIAAAWLAETFLFPGEVVKVVFVPYFAPGRPLPAADCLVDVACVHDPKRLIFDHKPPAFADRNTTCATRLVWEHLLSLGRPVAHLEALVLVVQERDRFPQGRRSPELARSLSEGFHFQIKQAKARLKQAGARRDGDLYQVMKDWLDGHDKVEETMPKPEAGESPKGTRTGRDGDESADAGARRGGPGAATSVTAGAAGPGPRARKPPAVAGAPHPSPDPPPAGDGLLSLEALLTEYVTLCRRGGTPGADDGPDPADRLVAMRGVIADRLAKAEPGSRAAAFLRGMRVLVEVERIAPGHLADRRRGADGWWSPLSHAKGTPGREASERVALEYGVGTGILEGEVRLAEAVEVITGNCGVGTLKLLLTPGGRLGVSVVLSIARKGARAAALRHGGGRPGARPHGEARPGRLADGHEEFREGPRPPGACPRRGGPLHRRPPGVDRTSAAVGR